LTTESPMLMAFSLSLGFLYAFHNTLVLMLLMLSAVKKNKMMIYYYP
jgi:hypothetical protein